MSIIYFDNNATTKVDERVLEEMLPYFSQRTETLPVKLHEAGWIADAAVEKARQQVANLIRPSLLKLFFTSGATESINTAFKGIFQTYKTKGIILLQLLPNTKLFRYLRYLKEGGADITC
ncbi:MAG: aminotransferase class V-fold PLP-dependent enzyme [Sphingobacteriaceae bacterium]|nr:aminotransferase class V-fold PLP-dependent enzyme [Sphingobacteriaceae bacterium]